jgi:hypothetical protein
METINENSNEAKKRHGCVTAFLIWGIILSLFPLFLFFYFRDYILPEDLPNGITYNMMIIIGIINAILYIVCIVMLFRWKKWGFWGYILTVVLSIIINQLMGQDIGNPIFYFVSIVILFGVLQIKKNNISAWNNLE